VGRYKVVNSAAERLAGRRRNFAAQEALAAVYRPALRGFERNRGLPPALRAGGHGLRFREASARGTLALRLTVLAALRFVFKVLVMEEVLFSRRKYEVSTAVYTLENAILKIRHGHCAPLNNLNCCRIGTAGG